MHEAIKFSVFVLLLTMSLANNYDDEVEPVETEKQFILDQHKNTMEILKAEMEYQLEMLLANISEEFTRKLTASELKMESKIERLSETFSMSLNQSISNSDAMVERSLSNLTNDLIASDSKMERSLSNLSEILDSKMKTSNSNVEKLFLGFSQSFNKNLTSSGATVERSLASLTEALNRKLTASDLKLNSMETSLANISQTLNSKIMASDSKLETSLATVSQSINQSLPEMISPNNQTLSVPIGVPQEGPYGNIRTINFGRVLSERRNDGLNWMLQEPNTASIWFSIGMNNLDPNDYLTITGVSAGGETTRFQIKSTTPNRTEFTITGFVAFVTLTINSEVFHPSLIKLWYRTNNTGVETYRSYRREVITKEGLQDVSFPQGNAENYTNYATSAILIAPPSGREFKITLKYLDAENCCSCDFLKVISLDGNSTISSSQAKSRPDPNKKSCGPKGVTYETLGYSTAAVLFFRSDHSVVGKGYKVEIRPE